MTGKRNLPRSVFERSGTYWLVRAEGAKRLWIKLTRVKDGLPALYLALAKAVEAPGAPDAMPAVIGAWQEKVMPRHADTTQRDERAMCKRIAEAFAEFRASQVEPPDVVEYLDQYADKPRTYNAHRSMIGELMRFAEERGWRPAGTNPVRAIRTMATPARERYISDSELRRIKHAAVVASKTGHERKTRRTGYMLCALIDMAVLAGQRIGDLVDLEWPAVGREGITFRQGKTGARVLVEWTPKLLELRDRLKAMRAETEQRKRGKKIPPRVFLAQDGSAYSYWAAASAWRRALGAAGIEDAHFHDLRAKAGTEKEVRDGMQGARVLLGHTTEQQTSSYVRNRSARRTRASR